MISVPTPGEAAVIWPQKIVRFNVVREKRRNLMDTHKGFWFCGEIAGQKLAPITIELLGSAESLPMNWARDF